MDEIYIEDEAGRIFNIEVQTSEKKNLPKRMGYYKSVKEWPEIFHTVSRKYEVLLSWAHTMKDCLHEQLF